jgi:Na+/melibiose symporter-like transporter
MSPMICMLWGMMIAFIYIYTSKKCIKNNNKTKQKKKFNVSQIFLSVVFFCIFGFSIKEKLSKKKTKHELKEMRRRENKGNKEELRKIIFKKRTSSLDRQTTN